MASVDDASSLPPPRAIEELCVELKTMIDECLTSTCDQKALCLTSKTWANITLPALWKTWHSDMTLPGARKLRALTNPHSKIAKHVENIVLTGNWECGDHPKRVLLQILKRIPKKKESRLRGFHCPPAVSDDILKSVLASHELVVLGTSNATWNKLISSNAQMNVSSLERIRMRLNKDGEAPKRENIVQLCPQLKHLKFTGPRANFEHCPSASSTGIDWLNVRTTDSSAPEVLGLSLRSLSFRKTSLRPIHSLGPRVDTLQLQHLALINVRSPHRLIESLDRDFQGRENGLLTFTLVDITGTTPAELSASLTAFLGSFQGLEQLHIRTDCDRVDGAVIANHHATLTTLSFVGADSGHRNDGRTLNISDLGVNATSCNQLQNVCLNIYNLHTEQSTGGRDIRT